MYSLASDTINSSNFYSTMIPKYGDEEDEIMIGNVIKRASSARSHSPKPLNDLKEDLLRPKLLNKIRLFLVEELKLSNSHYGQLQVYKSIFEMFITGLYILLVIHL